MSNVQAMKDLSDPKWMYLKAGLFLIIGLVCGVLLYAGAPHWRTAILAVLLVWSMCRAYYFAFYVIGRYIDPKFKYSGLISCFRYLARHRRFSRPALPQTSPRE